MSEEAIAEPGFEVDMVAPSTIGGTAIIGRGADGFREVWLEWTGSFESFPPGSG